MIAGEAHRSIPLITQNLDAWDAALKTAPDCLRHTVLPGIKNGFRIGFNGFLPEHSGENLRTAENLDAKIKIAKYLFDQCSKGFIYGPIDPPKDLIWRGDPSVCTPGAKLVVNPLGTVPKEHGSTEIRMIEHISKKDQSQFSINGGIDKETSSSLRFPSLLNVVLMLLNCLFAAKLDWSGAYRQIPVHPKDCHLLCKQFEGMLFIECRVPFGLSSAGKIFSFCARTVVWIACNERPDLFFDSDGKCLIDSLLDDMFYGHQTFDLNLAQHNYLKKLAVRLGVVLKVAKEVSPSQILTILGIQYNLILRTVGLDHSKIERYSRVIRKILQSKGTSQHDIHSVYGKMIFASSVMPFAKSFTRSVLHLSLTRKFKSAWISLNPNKCISRAALVDLECFLYLLGTETSIPFNRILQTPNFDLVAHTDAAGGVHLGFGGICDRNIVYGSWKQFPVPDYVLKSRASNVIDFMELFAVIALMIACGPIWKGKTILFFVDNTVVLSALIKQGSRVTYLNPLIRFVAAHARYFDINYIFKYVPSAANWADPLSRFNFVDFGKLMSHS